MSASMNEFGAIKRCADDSISKLRSVAVIGGGIIGRLLSWTLLMNRPEKPQQVTLFERGSEAGCTSSSFIAGGLLTPVSEVACGADRVIFDWGKDALERWRLIVEALKIPDALRNDGSLVVAHERELGGYQDFTLKLQRQGGEMADAGRFLNKDALHQIEPCFKASPGIDAGLLIRGEGSIEPARVMHELLKSLRQLGATIHFDSETECSIDGHISIKKSSNSVADSSSLKFDHVFDCRGLGARSAVEGLRGVRGELILVRAPDVQLSRPVRLLHQRHPIYVIPRAADEFAIGATSLESESMAPVAVQSAIELLAAACALHPGFRYASIINMLANLRPAVSDNLPIVRRDGMLTTINGLYRHGYLLAPHVVAVALSQLSSSKNNFWIKPNATSNLDGGVHGVIN